MAFLRRAGIILIVVALVAGLGATVAGAKKKHKKKVHHWPSEITLTHPTESQFAGVVRSKLDACRKSRVIGLYYTDPATGQTTPISVQRSDGDGRYQVNLPKPAYAGDYQAVVIEQRIRAMKAPQICKEARSAIVTI